MNTVEQLKIIKRNRLSDIDLYLINLFEHMELEYEPIINTNTYIKKYIITNPKMYIIIINHNMKTIKYNINLIREIYVKFYNLEKTKNEIIKNIRNYFYRYNDYDIYASEMNL